MLSHFQCESRAGDRLLHTCHILYTCLFSPSILVSGFVIPDSGTSNNEEDSLLKILCCTYAWSIMCGISLNIKNLTYKIFVIHYPHISYPFSLLITFLSSVPILFFLMKNHYCKMAVGYFCQFYTNILLRFCIYFHFRKAFASAFSWHAERFLCGRKVRTNCSAFLSHKKSCPVNAGQHKTFPLLLYYCYLFIPVMPYILHVIVFFQKIQSFLQILDIFFVC